ncbi:MAG: DUF2232 domain-containing protein [Deltaproteobacteria bacterium]|nr:DUF2232 domain-containing protein [Deltaproteobacteria bacterium]
MRRLDFIKSFFLALVSTMLLFVSGVAIPLVGVLLVPLVPQPALAFGLRWGKASGTGLLLLATLLLFFLGGKELALGYFLLALMTVLLLFFFGRGWSIESVVAGTAGGVLAAVYAALFYFFGSLSLLQQILRAALRENLEISLKVYEKIGFSGESLEVLRGRAPQIIDVMLRIMPALTFAIFVAVILMNLFFLCRRFPDHHLAFVSTGDVREWKSPEPLIWCFILSGFSLFLPTGEVVKSLALNFFLAVAVFYFLQGLAIVAYYFHHKKVPYFWRSLAYALIVFEQLFTLFVAGLGLFDLWGDFRRLKKKDLNPSQVS